MKLGLIGASLKHSFSQTFFQNLFDRYKLNNFSYQNFELNENELENFINDTDLGGFNVTIPHKKSIMNHLDVIDDSASAVGAVNTVVKYNKKWLGFNTDVIGLELSLLKFYPLNVGKMCLVLGTGGAAQAAIYVMNKLGKPFHTVSRSKNKGDLTYSELLGKMRRYDLIVNTTPVGMYPMTDRSPNIPYDEIDKNFYAYDMIYNPKKTLFLRNCMNQNAHTTNGEKMLILQAQASWVIWNEFINK